ncbi:transporter [Lithospermum erythrorhizon]|uniref:Transporter n=1 Tax=Lithospermum erythrorhizon TaxID=34254 RepID=A0AAV3NTM2_LITER
MGVVIESDVWEPNKSLNVFLFVACFLSIYFSPFSSSNSRTNISTVFDHSLPSSLLRFQRSFLLLYSLSSVLEGLWVVFGEFELAYYGVSRELMVSILLVGYGVSLLVSSFLGVVSDLIGPKRVCLLFYVLHLLVSIWKRFVANPSLWFASVALSIASSIYSFSFETWVVVEHDKVMNFNSMQLGQKQDMLNDMFWLMTFFESVSFVGSQILGNWFIGSNVEKNIASPSTAALAIAIICIIFVTRGHKEPTRTSSLDDYKQLFSTYILHDKRIWLLSWIQTCIHFSTVAFWILWAPLVVADGREVVLGLIYPCFLGARMLGSTAYPWVFSGPISFRADECLGYIFLIMGVLLSIIAYDYQEINILVTLFCLFHVCMGLVLPSVARLRTLCVPNGLRGGMMSLSLTPGNAAILILFVQRSYNRLENSTIIAMAALAMFSAAVCMYMLRQMGKQRENLHTL